MSRSELIAAAKAAGIKNASRTSSVELQAALAKMSKAKVKGGKVGRPIDPNSKRQAKASMPKGKKGRPIVEGSARQLREAAKAARAAANGGVVKKGRPEKAKTETAVVEG